MIRITIKNNEFSYDIKALAQAFYPGKTCEIKENAEWQELDGFSILCEIDGRERYQDFVPSPYSKNKVKGRFYDFLCTYSGNSLPWGILTGVRPAKIPLRMFVEGKQEKEIADCLRETYRCAPEKARLVVDVARREYALTAHMDHENSVNVYIGVPFCPSICSYCTFSSYPAGQYGDRMAAYLDALERELAYAGEAVLAKTLQTVYIGGGTPTAFDEEKFARLLDLVNRYLPMEHVREFTVEAGRPDSITENKLRCMKAHGVTRISINPQTMKQHTLERMGRKHSADDVRHAFAQAREFGFDNINMDLIAGLPEETWEDLEHTLEEVCRLEPDSITVHTLVIKRASRMRREQMESRERFMHENPWIPAMQAGAERFCRSHGYEPYYMYRQKNKAFTSYNTNQENVAYARPGKECLYNILMMEELEDIVALGSGASSKYVFSGENRVERVENVKNVDDYISRIDEMIRRKSDGIKKETGHGNEGYTSERNGNP